MWIAKVLPMFPSAALVSLMEVFGMTETVWVSLTDNGNCLCACLRRADARLKIDDVDCLYLNIERLKILLA